MAGVIIRMNSKKFLKKFDSDWERYNRDLIREVQDYQKEQEDAK